MTTTLTDFLLARIAEDEDSAQRVIADVPRWDSPDWAENVLEIGSDLPASLFTARMSPARVLAECEAKRRIVDEVYRLAGGFSLGVATLYLLRVLALPYADHPDYREEWRP